MKKIGLVIGSISLLSAGAAWAAINCTAAPSCASLGYNNAADDCNGSYIVCPFDTTKVFCNDVKKNIELVECRPGTFFYSDGTCTSTSELLTNKTLLGIVSYLAYGKTMVTWGGLRQTSRETAEAACENSGASLAPDQDVTPFASNIVASNSVVAAPVCNRKYWQSFNRSHYVCSSCGCERVSGSPSSAYYYCEKYF